LAQHNEQEYTNWGVLILSAISLAFFIAIPMSSMPVLFKEIAGELSLNSVQIGLIWGVLSFGGIVVSLIGGIICDRLGYKRTIVILGLLSGLTGAARGLSNGFTSIFITTMVWGVVSSALAPSFTIICSLFASRRRQGFSQGFLMAGGAGGLAVGSMISSTILSPMFGGWRNVFFVFGAITILLSLFWLFKIKVPDHLKRDINQQSVPFRKAFTYLIRSKPLWILSISFMAYQACSFGMQGYIAYFLENFGWTAVAASGVLSIYCLVGAVFAIPGSLLSDRLGLRKSTLFGAFITAIVGVGLLSVVHNGFVWILIILAGLFAFVTNALFSTICIEILSKESSYIGTGVGFMLCISSIGRTISPPLGNSLADINSNIAWPFIFWAALGLAGAIMLVFVKETGWKNKNKL
jgi:MFS transporter, ACS family, glucarate transporter